MSNHFDDNVSGHLFAIESAMALAFLALEPGFREAARAKMHADFNAMRFEKEPSGKASLTKVKAGALAALDRMIPPAEGR